jgi:NAD(P)-dependent dehydrogenase (short-subunit alcohol dehydrogenase family)
MKKAIVTGASRGIGLEFTRQLLEQGYQVLGISRFPTESEGLLALNGKWKDNLRTLAADLEDPDSYRLVAEKILDWPHLNLLLNNAGVYFDEESSDALQRSFQINAIAPFMLFKALRSKLKAALGPHVINVSSQMGSIADNHSGGSHAYRASKAALNMFMKGVSIEEPWLTTVSVHPGWVKTSMGGDNAPTSIEDSVTGLMRVLQGLRSEDSGRFINYRGENLPW